MTEEADIALCSLFVPALHTKWQSSLFVIASSESSCERPGKTSSVFRSRKTKIYAKRSSAMPLCRSACVKRYSLVCIFFLVSAVCFASCLFTYFKMPVVKGIPRLFSLSKMKMVSLQLLVSHNCWYSLSLPRCLRESRCGPTPRSVSTKCEPPSSPYHSRPKQ